MAAPLDLAPEQQLRESFLKHASRAQLYRLCDQLAHPRPSDDLRVALTTLIGSTPKTVGRIERCDMNVGAAGLIEFEAGFTDGAIWRGAFSSGEPFLPHLARFDATGGAAAAEQRPADDRIRSAVHYFIALVENPARDPEPFRELLCDTFSLHYTQEPIEDFDAVRVWVTGRLASVVASEHDIHRISCKTAPDGTYSAEVVMKSQALFPDGSGAISRNTQRWTLRDDPTDRFPRITEIFIDRDAVEFFGPAPDYEPRALPG